MANLGRSPPRIFFEGAGVPRSGWWTEGGYSHLKTDNVNIFTIFLWYKLKVKSTCCCYTGTENLSLHSVYKCVKLPSMLTKSNPWSVVRSLQEQRDRDGTQRWPCDMSTRHPSDGSMVWMAGGTNLRMWLLAGQSKFPSKNEVTLQLLFGTAVYLHASYLGRVGFPSSYWKGPQGVLGAVLGRAGVGWGHWINFSCACGKVRKSPEAECNFW